LLHIFIYLLPTFAYLGPTQVSQYFAHVFALFFVFVMAPMRRDICGPGKHFSYFRLLVCSAEKHTFCIWGDPFASIVCEG